MPDPTLDLKLSLLRGETPSPLDLDSFARPDRIRLRTQTKSAVSDRLAVRLLSLIASGRLPPGCRLPPERLIAETLAVSRVCVRTALDRLKGEGYLHAMQGSGTHVAPAEDGGHVVRLVAANAANLRDLAEICGALQDWALDRALLAGPPEPREQLIHLLEQPAPAGAAAHEPQVRRALALASGSTVFARLMDHLAPGIDRAVALGRAHREVSIASLRLARALRHGERGAARAALAERTALLLQGSGASIGAAAAPETPEGNVGILSELAIAAPHQLRDRLAGEIARLMDEQGLAGGSKLPSERQLADLFGVSRMSVREALASLKERGFVCANPRTGTHVWGALPHRAEAPGAPGLRRSAESFKEVCALRHYLEAWSARRAAITASDGDRADLRRILAEMQRSIPSARRKIDLDLRLHLTITRAAGSAVALYITEVLRDFFSDYFDYTLTEVFVSPDRDETLLRQHTHIVEAIMARDPERAALAMQAHCRTFCDVYDILQATGEGAPLH